MENEFMGIPWEATQRDLTAAKCPHCQSELKEYAYGLHSCHHQFLTALLKYTTSVSKKQMRGLSKRAYNTGSQVWRWGLIASEGRGNRGPWRITAKGHAFITGNLLIPERAVVFMRAGTKSPVVRFEGKAVSFAQLQAAHVDETIYDVKVDERRRARRVPVPDLHQMAEDETVDQAEAP